MQIRKNIVILTHGWTGSSIFSALFGEVGYWLGDKTMVKPDYDTFENAGLVAWNEKLLRQLAPDLNHEHQFSDSDIEKIANRADSTDLSTCQDFVADCNRHRPWVWKDPRLTWTIRAWAKVMNFEQTAFLVLTRDQTQAWISANLRRHVQSFKFTRDYNGGVTRSNLRFLEEHGLQHMQLSFEDLLLEPEATIANLNAFFGVNLSLMHLTAVCKSPLKQKSRGWKDFIVASLIFLKNFHERDGRGRLGAPSPRPFIK